MSGSVRNSENLPGDGDSSAHTENNVETKARRLGWRPKDQFRGDPDQWVDADEFVRRGEEQVPLLRENLRKAEHRNNQLAAEIRGFQGEMSAMRQQVQESREVSLHLRNMLETGEERAYKRAIADINERMEASAADGDVAGVRKAREDLEELNKARPPAAVKAADKADTKVAKTAEPPPPNPVAVAWVNSEEQSWFRENRDAEAWAIAVQGKLEKDPNYKHLSLEDQLAEVRSRAMKKFPEYFDENEVREIEEREADTRRQPQRRQTSPVNTGRSPSSSSSARGKGDGNGFDDIPESDQKQFFKIQRELKEAGAKKEYTKEQYAKDYWFGDRPQQDVRG